MSGQHDLTITLSLQDRQLLTDLLSAKLQHIAYADHITSRTEFNMPVELPSHINGTSVAKETRQHA